MPVAAAVVAAVAALALGVVVLRSGDGGGEAADGPAPTCTSGSAPAPTADGLALPAALAGEDRLLVPLVTDLGGELRDPVTGTPTVVPGPDDAEVRYAGGGVVRYRARSGTAAEAAPMAFPASDAEAIALGSARTAASGLTASGRVVTVETPVDVRRPFLEPLARGAAELPETLARAVADGSEVPSLAQPFEVAGQRFLRTTTVADGNVTVSTDLESAGEGLRGDGRELSLLVGAAAPEEVLAYEEGDRQRWLAFVPAGLQVELDTATGDRCTVLADALTGGEYWLVEDGDGDGKAHAATTTQGAPTRSTFTVWVG